MNKADLPASFKLRDVHRWAIESASDAVRRSTVEFCLLADELARLSSGSQVYDDPYVILQLSTGAQGYVFAHPGEVDRSSFAEIVGRQVQDLPYDLPPVLLTALADAACQERADTLQHELIVLIGSSTAKSEKRAKIITNFFDTPAVSSVGLVGAIEDIAARLALLSEELLIADYHLSGGAMSNSIIGSDYVTILERCDAALLTGNILKTDTLSHVIEIIQRRRIPAAIYAMSGHNVFPLLLPHMPFRRVTSEQFPFYWFAATESKLRIYRAKGEPEA